MVLRVIFCTAHGVEYVVVDQTVHDQGSSDAVPPRGRPHLMRCQRSQEFGDAV
jgi:hypothetical protein